MPVETASRTTTRSYHAHLLLVITRVVAGMSFTHLLLGVQEMLGSGETSLLGVHSGVGHTTIDTERQSAESIEPVQCVSRYHREM